jgi:type II secretory ATPase GspE/PulE/Tfp pilus assembly ATPase PilB-like protein
MKQVSENEETINIETRPVPAGWRKRRGGTATRSSAARGESAKELARRYRLPFVDCCRPIANRRSTTTLSLKFRSIDGAPPVSAAQARSKRSAHRDGGSDRPRASRRTFQHASPRVVPHVATAGAIEVVLRKGDTTQRVLQEAASGFRISLVKETEHGEEVLDLDRLATDSEMSPIIKLVDTIIYNAMESRASDIHIETRDTEVQVKYRIDGALYAKVDPIDLAYHQTLISRIKVMSELDIAERRVPQDGASEFVTKDATSISAFRSCRRFTAKTRSFVFSTKNRSTKSSKT